MSFGVNRKMHWWEAGEQWPGRAHPSRLWVDIWSQSQWNVRRVMTGMVIGRLWLTSDLEVLKGHSSLNCLWANVLSDHGMIKEKTHITKAKQGYREKFTKVNISEQIVFVRMRLFSSKLTVHYALPPLVTVARPVKLSVLAQQIQWKLVQIYPLKF